MREKRNQFDDTSPPCETMFERGQNNVEIKLPREQRERRLCVASESGKLIKLTTPKSPWNVDC